MEELNDIEFKDFKYFLEELEYKIKSQYRLKNRVKQVLTLYSLLGILTFIFGVIYFVLSLLKFQISEQQSVTLVFSGVGLVIAVGSRFYSQFIAAREKETNEIKIELEKLSNFIINWSTLERVLQRYIDINGLSNNKFAIIRNLNIALDKGLISSKDFLIVEKSLDIRNQILHGKVIVAKDSIDKYSENLQEITDRIVSKM